MAPTAAPQVLISALPLGVAGAHDRRCRFVLSDWALAKWPAQL